MAKTFADLVVYQSAFRAALAVFEASKSFPKEERFALTDQARRSSRAVSAMIAEAWGRRRYRAVFVNKLDEAIGEACETQAWLEFAKAHEYISGELFGDLSGQYQSVGGRLRRMIDRADDFCKFAPGTDYRNVVREDADDVDDSPFTSHQSPSA